MFFQRSKAPKEPEATFERAMAELKLKSEVADGVFIGKMDRWDVNLDAGLITFTRHDMVASAPVQVIGTYNTEEETWLWGWDHPSVDHHLARDARLARDFGQKHRLTDYTTRKITCTETDCWRYTAVACYLAKAFGAYRGPAGPTLVFMTFGNLTVRKP